MSDSRARCPAPVVTGADGRAGHIRHPADAHGYPIDLASLAGVRAAAVSDGLGYGLPDGPLNDLVLIANELATNAVRHGGGSGRMWLWCGDGRVYCQVVDQGSGMSDPDHAGEKPTDRNALTGRGLWLIRQMAERIDIDTGMDGTTVTVAIPLNPLSKRPEH
ncbi:MAG TPA: ATP-binding protein [Micromonosporaceae bacterium]|jgi:anti-sigma regulatory factor (Ser/Thr protein kinase)